MKFFSAPNLISRNLRESSPWDFSPAPDRLAHLRTLPKPLRRRTISEESTLWDVYTPVRALNPADIVSKENPPVAVRGFVADYDVRQPLDTIVAQINQIPESLQPTYLEITLGQKCRLVWAFATEIPVVDSAFLERFWRELSRRGKFDVALAGFDEASYKPAERWTNGGCWYDLETARIPHDILVGCAVEAGKALDNVRQEVPLDIIAEEVKKRFPGRWQGDFKIDALGVRFWDAQADAPAGAQVKPDGMLCFTGSVGFVKWREIFGPQWVDEQSALNMGRAVRGIHFDGKNYWMMSCGRWCPYTRTDILTHISARGLSPTKAKGQTLSDAELALVHVQLHQRIDGAAPLINERPGVVELRGRNYLNIARLNTVLRSGKTDVNAGDFPWIWEFIESRFEDQKALWTFLAWLRRGHLSLTEYRRYMGQIVFICGPKNSGKTLLTLRVMAPILGGMARNPYDYFVGSTTFTDDLFEAPFWAINDEDAPSGDAQRAKFVARLKATAVNPEHTYHPKFCSKLTVSWQGRMVVTLNDDPSSVGILPEVNDNTADKLIFLRFKPYTKAFPPNDILESMIAAELPHFVEFLHQWDPPEEVVANNRMGVESYFDPEVLAMARHQHASHNLAELLAKWILVGAYWQQEGADHWEGTATDLLSDISSCDPLARLADEWRVSHIAKRLLDLTKVPDSGVSLVEGSDRTFRIDRKAPTR